MSDRPATLRVDLPGRQDRLRQLILHVCEACRDAERFGAIKLNKILWRADFSSFAKRLIPVSGREYKRLPFGPAPKEMPVLMREMQAQGLIRLDKVALADGMTEHRAVALARPYLGLFSGDDMTFVRDSIAYYWDKTGVEASDDSHGAAWLSRNNGDLMPYELALLSDEPLSKKQFMRLQAFAEQEGLSSL